MLDSCFLFLWYYKQQHNLLTHKMHVTHEPAGTSTCVLRFSELLSSEHNKIRVVVVVLRVSEYLRKIGYGILYMFSMHRHISFVVNNHEAGSQEAYVHITKTRLFKYIEFFTTKN